VATLADTVSFSNSEYAGAIATAGRTVSSIVDVTAGNTAVTASNVLKRNLSTDPYTLDLSTLTVGHTYRLTLITTNIVTGEMPSTTATYYLTLDEGTTEPGDNEGEGTTGGVDNQGTSDKGGTFPSTGDTSVPFLVMSLLLTLMGSLLIIVSRIRQKRVASHTRR
jgi:LPXTG-motif cell wall-anchored protein